LECPQSRNRSTKEKAKIIFFYFRMRSQTFFIMSQIFVMNLSQKIQFPVQCSCN
jgi:hypothetical protein